MIISQLLRYMFFLSVFIFIFHQIPAGVGGLVDKMIKR